MIEEIIHLCMVIIGFSTALYWKGQHPFKLDLVIVLLLGLVWCIDVHTLLFEDQTLFLFNRVFVVAALLFLYFRKGHERKPLDFLLLKEDVSRHLYPLVQEAYHELTADPLVLESVKASLERLLLYLTRSSERSDADCLGVSVFFENHARWKRGRSGFPEDLEELLDDLGLFLKYTVKEPEVALKHRSTPAELLARIQGLSFEQ